MSEKLLPCPFCGGEAMQPEKISSGRPIWVISCNGFCCSIKRVTKKQAIEDWNTRIEVPTHETLEQYKACTGKDYPDDWAVYYNNCDEWEVDYCWYAKLKADAIIVTAERGKPDPDWRPE